MSEELFVRRCPRFPGLPLRKAFRRVEKAAEALYNKVSNRFLRGYLRWICLLLTGF